MKLLVYTHAFAPKVGGVETVVMSLATGLTRGEDANRLARPEVSVVTRTPGGGYDDASLPFRVVREPGLLELARLVREADVLHLAGPALPVLLLGLLLRKPVVVEHHGFQTICPNGQLLHEPSQKPCPGHFMGGRHTECIRCNAQSGLFRSVKWWLLTFPRRWLCRHWASNIMPTNWLSGLLRLPRSITIHHGLNARKTPFTPVDNSSNRKFAFVGRLVSTKGVETLLRAAEWLNTRGFAYHVKVIGDGPSREALQQQAASLGIEDLCNSCVTSLQTSSKRNWRRWGRSWRRCLLARFLGWWLWRT